MMSNRKTRNKQNSEKIIFAKDVRSNIIAIILLIFCVISSLKEYFNQDALGLNIFHMLSRFLFGLMSYTIPLICLGLAIRLIIIRTFETAYNIRFFIGLLTLMTIGCSMIQIIKGCPFINNNKLNESGGIIGFIIANPLSYLVTNIGAMIILGLLSLLCIVFITGVSFNQIFLRIKFIFSKPNPEQPQNNNTKMLNHDLLDKKVDKILENKSKYDEKDQDQAQTQIIDDNAEEDNEYSPIESPQETTVLSNTKKILNNQAHNNLRTDINETDYVLPDINLLKPGVISKVSTADSEKVIRQLNALFKEFDTAATVTDYTRGPTVTRYEVEIGDGVKVQKVIGLSENIAYTTATADVRIISPIPGKSAIGIEIPNAKRDTVSLNDILKDVNVSNNTNPMLTAIGKDVEGKHIVADLRKMPHLLVAGTTGSGKSSFINSLLIFLLMRAKPEELRMVLIDPKRVELSDYEGIPHLITPIITNPKKAANALEWVVNEMVSRYDDMEKCGYRNIDSFNEAIRSGKVTKKDLFPDRDDYEEFSDQNDEIDSDGKDEQELTPYPYLLVVIDEFSDLMQVASKDVESSVVRITQLARAAGIHLVLATQRPSVDVITGLIKSNMPSRLAFAVSNGTDSRVVLDVTGAEKLIGVGDSLFSPSGSSPLRVQGCFVSDKEIKDITNFVKNQRKPIYNTDVDKVLNEEKSKEMEEVGKDLDDLLNAAELVISNSLGSTSMLQRKLRIGFAKAGRLMDLLEQFDIVGPSEGSKPREVYVKPECLQEALDKIKGK